MLRLKCIGTGSKGNCYLLETFKHTLILDAGLPIKTLKRAMDFDFSTVVGCVVTHEHDDHMHSAKDLSVMGIPVFYGFRDEKRHVKYGPFDIWKFPVPHDVPCVGYYITVDGITTVYITDAQYCGWNFRGNKVHNFLVECNWQNEYVAEDMDEPVISRIFQTHMSEDVCVRFLEANKTDEMSNVLICHMSERRCNPEEAVERIQAVLGDEVFVEYCKPRGCYSLERRERHEMDTDDLPV